MSIQPKWCELIAQGKKTVEVRKTRPKIKTPFKCYIYETKGNVTYTERNFRDEKYNIKLKGRGKVIGEFVCDYIASARRGDYGSLSEAGNHCVETTVLLRYAKRSTLYGWHISDLKIYDKSKDLSEFCTIDEKAVQNCICREQVGQPEYKTQHCGWIKGGFVCNNTEDWCTKCKRKPLRRPPQSWC